jgi:Flp pilus assembly protein TadB
VDEQARQALHDIERNLVREDPVFAARMRAEARETPRFPTVSALCASLYILIPIVMILFGSPGVVVTVDVFAIAIGTVLIRRHRRHRRS